MKFFATLTALAVVGSALAQDGHKHDHKHGHDHDHDHDHAHQHDKDKGDKSHQEMMDAWMALSVPGPEHKLFEPMVGEWTTTSKNFMEPGAEPMESTGSCTYKWIFDGRYLECTYQGEMMGMPFVGRGVAGFDRMQKKYIHVWMDSMSTQMMWDIGEYDPSKKKFTYRGKFHGPDGNKYKSRTEITIHSDKKHVLEMYHPMPGQGDEMVRVMEITYTRKSASASAK